MNITTNGNIFVNVKQYETRVKVAEEEIIQNNISENRAKLHQVNTEYIKFMKIEESILKQKTSTTLL